MNSVQNKLDLLAYRITGCVDVFMIDDTFPSVQFVIAGFAVLYKLDQNCNKGGILLYIREDIPSK